jgi:hypothetical protein
MVSYSLYIWDGASYNPALLRLLFPFVDAYIALFGEQDEHCAAEIFRIFTFFFDGNEFAN